mmetsp:Transcript_48057/g.88532  ORF Transcript_48057/g.88532 Transcript_48057/m.88532 type:complete len:234 (-) Transcript_48057:237-938(-)
MALAKVARASSLPLCGAYSLFGLVCISLCWLWPDFVDRATARGEFKKVRMVLNFLLLVQSLVEISMWTNGVVRAWMLIPIIFTNVWGMLDANLRYPIVHTVDSNFNVKQVLMLAARFVCYTLGFCRLADNAGLFFLWQCAGVVMLPILWLFALPITDSRCNHMKHGAMEEDILVHLWRMMSNPADRKQIGQQLRVLTCRSAVTLVSVVPSLKSTIVMWDPSLARVLCNTKLLV